MADHTSILSQRWTDIVPPTAPPPLAWWLLLSAGVLALLVVVVVWLLWQQRPRQRGLRVLRHCRQQLQSLSVDSHEIALRIYRALLQGLAESPARLAATAVRDPHWLAFYRRLQGCVFAGSSPNRDELLELIRQARYWLRHYR